MTFAESGRPAGPPPRHPSRTRGALAVATLVWTALEIWLLVVVASAIGGWWVLLILAAGVVLGGAAVKRAGRRAWRSLTTAVRTGADGPGGPPRPGEPVPGSEGAGTAMLGGLLLMLPGLLSDAAGLLCLFPPTRKVLMAGGRLLLRRVSAGRPGGSPADAFARARMRMPDGKVVQGEVVRDDDRPGPDGSGPDGPGGGPRRPLSP